MVKYIDTHAHIYKEYYDSVETIIDEISKSGIERIINSACDDNSVKEVLETSKKNNIVFCTIGIHPENVDNFSSKDLKYIESKLNEKKVVAIGEIGLDYHYTKENKTKQISLFETQLALAEKYNLPVVVHSRDATKDTIECLKKYRVKGVIHSFSGSYETAVIYQKMGFYLGINGVITFKNSNLKDVIKLVDINKILLETDSPYLSPEPYRGKKNDSRNIKLIAKYVSNLFNISEGELSKITNENAYRIFDKLK